MYLMTKMIGVCKLLTCICKLIEFIDKCHHRKRSNLSSSNRKD